MYCAIDNIPKSSVNEERKIQRGRSFTELTEENDSITYYQGKTRMFKNIYFQSILH